MHRPPTLPPDPQALDQGSILRHILTPDVLEQPLALPDHLEQPEPGVVILAVGFEVLRQVVDPAREQRDLDFGRAGIALVHSEVGDDRLFRVCRESHSEVVADYQTPLTWAKSSEEHLLETEQPSRLLDIPMHLRHEVLDVRKPELVAKAMGELDLDRFPVQVLVEVDDESLDDR
jgi:hypothetical protein